MYHKHGMSKTSIYRTWADMVRRCSDEKYWAYGRYGGRGINVCERWLDFNNFREDMQEGHSSGMSIERINIDDHYCKSNCKWIHKTEQTRNRSNTWWIEYKGEKICSAELCRRLGMNPVTFFCRIKRLGWSIEEALNTPVRLRR